jgi:hypothetical protein
VSGGNRYKDHLSFYGPEFDFLKKQLTMAKKKKEEPLSKPDKETLNTTDPQENMEGPVSSVMQGIKEEAGENDEEDKAEADKKKNKNK